MTASTHTHTSWN